MNIIAKQTFRFVRPGRPNVTVQASPLPQTVPDDIAEDSLFELAVKSGHVVKLVTAPAAESPVMESTPQEPAQPVPQPKAPQRATGKQPASA